MADLQAQFAQAAQDAQELPARPDNETLLRLYGLYKQATVGDNDTKKPGFTDFVGRAKWDAWDKLSGQTPDEAMQAYIDLVDQLKGASTA